MSLTIVKQHNPDINGIALDLREIHRDDFFSVLENNLLKRLAGKWDLLKNSIPQ